MYSTIIRDSSTGSKPNVADLNAPVEIGDPGLKRELQVGPGLSAMITRQLHVLEPAFRLHLHVAILSINGQQCEHQTQRGRSQGIGYALYSSSESATQ